jgi:two-component system sensor histidine kinase BaeS
MNVNRKLFTAMAAFIVAMSLVFVFMTHLVVRESLEAIVDFSKGTELDTMSKELIQYYQQNGNSWEGVQINRNLDSSGNHQEISILLVSSDDQEIAAVGETPAAFLIKKFGIERKLKVNGQTIAIVYYYDTEVANLSKLRIGIPISVTLLLSVSAIIFILLSLLVAYWLSKRLTAPLRQLISAIDQLGKGKFGIQAPVSTTDEYGRVASAFNDMSTQLQRAEEVRRNLVADVAHELRTPLTIIRGKLDLHQQSDRPIDPENLLPLQDELIRLTRLVDDLHLLSLAEARKLPNEKKPTNITELLKRIIEHVTPDAELKEIQIKLASSTDITMIQMDPNRMTQVFLNLIVNAVRYIPDRGLIEVTIHEEAAAQDGQPILRITIADNGPGIDPEHLPYLFSRFYRTDAARARNNGGMGLGLAIAKELVLTHNGTIEVESSIGKGTAFSVRLPINTELSDRLDR